MFLGGIERGQWMKWVNLCQVVSGCFGIRVIIPT